MQFSALFSYTLWHIELKFCIRLCFTVLQIKFECRQFPSIFVGVTPLLECTILKIHSFPHFSLTRFDLLLKFCTSLRFTVLQIKFECCQFASIFVGVMPLLDLRILEIHSFPHFSLTRFDILSWNFTFEFVSMYYRSSLSAVTLRQFLKELCVFVNLEYGKYEVFRTFLLHALTYWAEIFHMTLFNCTTDQVPVLSISVNFWWSYTPFWTQNTENTQFSALFSFTLWHIELKFCIWVCFTELRIKAECLKFASIFVGVMPLLEHWILEIHSFLHFSPTCFDILSWNFTYDFV